MITLFSKTLSFVWQQIGRANVVQDELNDTDYDSDTENEPLQVEDELRAKESEQLEDYWNEEDGNNPHQNEERFNIGVILSMSKDVLTLKDGNSISLKDAILSDFKPQVGDVIQFSFASKELKPSRTREIEGEITRIKADRTGTINDEVWFDFSTCMNGFYPKRGISVVATAVENHQDFYMWRATSVVPKKLPRPSMINTYQLNKSPTQKCFLQDLLSDKNGITISTPLDFGIMMQGMKGYITVHIKNNGECQEVLTQCRIQRKETLFTLGATEVFKEEQTNISSDAVVLLPGTAAYVNIYCDAKELGKHKEMLLFHFEGYEIGRYITVQVKHPLQESVVQKNSLDRREYNHNRWESNRNRQLTNWQTDNWVLPGEKPFRTRHYLPVSLPMFAIPDKLKLAVLDRGDILSVAHVLAQNLSEENYAERFSCLLHLEEIQMQIIMRQFAMHDVCLTPMGSELLALHIPGLAEGRPSLLVGDKVYLLSPDGSPGPVYQGYIHEVLMNQVLIKFHSSFHMVYSGESYDIEFEISRTNMRRCHKAANQAISLVLPEVLFPKTINIQPPKFNIKSEIEYFNKQLNVRQRSAVRRILEHQCRPLPYIIFGPPGTGKTVTLVEAVLQVFTKIKSSRLIICAPTNSAADLITFRLHQSGLIGVIDLARINAFQRNKDSVPESIQQYCFYSEDDLNKLIYYRIIVSTLGTVGILYGLKLGTQHFTHFFLDEAGQATEPESLVGMELVTAAGMQGQVVVAGDPKQLGPVLTSSYSSFYGLQISFLERLMSRHLYSRDTEKFADHGSYDPLLVTKLVENYRSHSALLKVYSDLFYNSELEPKANNLIPVLWNKLHDIDFPMIFHGIKGEEIRESDSPSWFNPAEVVQIVTYLQELYGSDVNAGDIGIITPYRKQVEKVKLLCGTLGLEICKIGSVEEFQGQEKRVILLSLVRCLKSENSDLFYSHLGFIGQPKRFNVAISRAQSLLIVIGDPELLMEDENWRTLLKYCIDNQAYVGCPVEL